jgi:hypothetical protein
MFAITLVVLAFGSGCAVMYFVMEGPRRRAREELARARDERLDLDDQRVKLEERERQVAARERTSAAAAAAHAQRTRELAAQAEALSKRVVGYDDLAAENRILKEDLRNVVTQIAHLECSHDEAKKALAAAMAHRDRLGRAYFDEVVAAARRGITPATYPANKRRVQEAVERVRAAGVGLAAAEEQRVLADLHALYERAVRAAVEREEQARIRERIRDEQQREREAQEAIEQAEREKRAIEDALRRALADAAGRHAAEVDRLRAQLAEAEARSRRAISLAEITRTGHVYVISNPGSFGPDVFKIGMTRRLDPMDRVQELGDASVPFPFDVHMIVTCDDAPKLEAALHRRFHKRRVNKVNPRKEFFRVSVDEIAQAVRELHGEVEYRADAEALEYLQSQATTDAALVAGAPAAAAAAAAAPATTGASGESED